MGIEMNSSSDHVLMVGYEYNECTQRDFHIEGRAFYFEQKKTVLVLVRLINLTS